MMHSIKNKFASLSKREQWLVFLGGEIIACWLVYYVLFSPLKYKTESTREAFLKNKVLITWIAHASHRILVSRQHAMPQRQPVSNVMVKVEHSLAENQLASYLQSVKQPQSNQVEISLHALPFDKFINWIQSLVSHYQLEVKEMQVTKGSRLGTANVKTTLKNSRS